MSSVSLYERIGDGLIRRSLTEFYVRAFEDGIIGHFFFGKDRLHITTQQIDFAIAMLGGPKNYRGKPLVVAHRDMKFRRPHFSRRQMLMREVLEELGLELELIDAWLELEEALRPLIVGRNN